MSDARRQRRLTSAPTPSHGSGTSSDPDVLTALMRRVARGDNEAFGALYDELSALVYGIVRRVLRDPSQSEEVTQEVFLEIWRLAPRFESSKGSIRGWCSGIAHRRAVDRVRSAEASRRRDDRHGDFSIESPDPVADEVADTLDQARVRQALDQLTELQRDAVELAYYGGLTYRQVATLLDVAEGTAKTRIRDGLIRLRDQMGVNS